MKYYNLLNKIITEGQTQENKKGNIKFLTNETLSMNVEELDELFNTHRIAKTKLKEELYLYLAGEDDVAVYREYGITWWDYIGDTFINSYPQYFRKIPKLINQINKEKRPSKNYVVFLGDNELPTNQLPCLSLIQFQIINNELYMTVFQRSADSNLGLPSDIYQMYLLSQMIDVPLKNITFFIGNAHIYENNIEKTKQMLNGEKVSFGLNV